MHDRENGAPMPLVSSGGKPATSRWIWSKLLPSSLRITMDRRRHRASQRSV
jgi:hypothetical protein